LSLDGIIALEVLDRPFTASAFNEFVEGLLDQMNAWPQKNSVVVMDNASIHKSEELRQMIEDRCVNMPWCRPPKKKLIPLFRGMRLVFLPAYSPDLNPIEEAFSSIKAWIRANRDYVLQEIVEGLQGDPYKVLWDAVFSVTPEKALGWFRHSGYIA
jgi:DDE superfamily endonuclease